MYQHLRSVLDECRNKKLIVNFYQWIIRIFYTDKYNMIEELENGENS